IRLLILGSGYNTMISHLGLIRTFLSPYYFSKLFKKYQGIGFNAWINQQRMASAKELLCHSDWSIASIARNLGFSQTSYFCKVFRQTYQVTPQAFRQQINAGSQTESF
uniref:helix-turn-helix transcriptional regulator n=1 Tax=Klebsiella sp. 10982 TaxID=1196034 RepID=UPI00046ECB08